MTLTRQHKVLLAVLGIGIVSLLMDRLFLGATGPESATATSQAAGFDPAGSEAGGSAMPARSVAQTWSLPRPNDQSIARRLDRYAEAAGLARTPVREAFVPSPNWIPPMPESAAAAGGGTVPDTRKAFTERHRLSGVMASGTSLLAMVDGVTLRVGQEYDGFTLVEVTQRTAVFDSPAGRVELRLKP